SVRPGSPFAVEASKVPFSNRGLGGRFPMRFNIHAYPRRGTLRAGSGLALVTRWALDVKRALLMAAVLAATASGTWEMTAKSDEGMWLLDSPPRKLLEERYRFKLTDEWRDRAMKASVRFTNGGSGGF